jgi:hypothetical protein
MDFVVPIGSVISVRGFEKRVMVAGVRQVEEETGKTWDYCGCFYPEGVINSRELVLFDQKHIDSLYFLGFRDGEGLLFTRKLLETGKMPSPPIPGEGD